MSDIAFIPVGKWETETFEVHPVYHFNHDEIDFANMDKCEDIIRDAVVTKEPVMPMMVAIVETLASQRMAFALAMVMDAKKPRMAIHQIICAAGLALEYGKTEQDYAKSYGVSKQAFQQGVERMRDKLGLRKTRAGRSDEAKAKMSLCNYRK